MTTQTPPANGEPAAGAAAATRTTGQPADPQSPSTLEAPAASAGPSTPDTDAGSDPLDAPDRIDPPDAQTVTDGTDGADGRGGADGPGGPGSPGVPSEPGAPEPGAEDQADPAGHPGAPTVRPARTRLLSPAALVLVLLLFALPFITVACDTPAGEVTVTYSGVDLALDTAPSIELPEQLREETGTDNELAESAVDVQLPTLITVGLLLIGIGLCFLRERRLSLLGVAGASTLAAAMLIVTELVAVSNLRDTIRELTGPEEMFGGTSNDEISAIVHLGYGFWAALALLILIAGYHAVGAVRAERAARAEEEEDFGEPLPLFGPHHE